jgi:hypothetical protein
MDIAMDICVYEHIQYGHMYTACVYGICIGHMYKGRDMFTQTYSSYDLPAYSDVFMAAGQGEGWTIPHCIISYKSIPTATCAPVQQLRYHDVIETPEQVPYTYD